MTPAETLRCAAVGITQAVTALERLRDYGVGRKLRVQDIEALESTLADLGRADEDVRGVAMGLEGGFAVLQGHSASQGGAP